MPELPEVETVCRGLREYAEGATVLDAQQYRADIRFAIPEKLTERIIGQVLSRITRRGKYILLQIGSEQFIAHLGMSGSFIVRDPQQVQTHEHLVWELSNGKQLVYHDPRRFGFFIDAPAGWHEHPMIQTLGVEPLSNYLHAAYLEQAFYGKKAPIKNALLDQSIIAGLGNIYVSEVLWRCGIHPARAAQDCTSHADDMVIHIRNVLEEAIDSGGSTLRDYATASGSSGYFQHHFNVYGREKQPCFRCETGIMRQVQAGRSSFFCPTCQPVL
jgi:formamidopyrimidine-DNA glycosylase